MTLRLDDFLDTHERVLEAARHLEFRMPGWEVYWRKGDADGATLSTPWIWGATVLTLVCRTVDTYTYAPGDEHVAYKQIRVVHRAPVPPSLRARELPIWFRNRVRDAVLHETDEWLRVDGVMVWDPHKH